MGFVHTENARTSRNYTQLNVRFYVGIRASKLNTEMGLLASMEISELLKDAQPSRPVKSRRKKSDLQRTNEEITHSRLNVRCWMGTWAFKLDINLWLTVRTKYPELPKEASPCFVFLRLGHLGNNYICNVQTRKVSTQCSMAYTS